MEARLAEFLQRLRDAEVRSGSTGEERQPFLLIYSAAGSVGIKHPGWDSSWMRPTAEDVDDLEELGFVRNEPTKNTKRVFALTVRGRQQADALLNPSSDAPVGQVPSLDQTLRWLAKLEQEEQAALAQPGGLPACAVAAGLIENGAEEAFAQRIIDLRSEGFLAGDVLDFAQAGPLQRLQISDGLRLTMKAHERLDSGASPAPSMNFYGSVVAGQIASGDINNFVGFGDLLDRAEAEIRELDDVSEDDRDNALALIDVLRGNAPVVGMQVLTGAGGGLLADVLARLVGLAPIG